MGVNIQAVGLMYKQRSEERTGEQERTDLLDSWSVVRMGKPSLELMKIPLYSASAAEDRTIFMILQRT